LSWRAETEGEHISYERKSEWRRVLKWISVVQ